MRYWKFVRWVQVAEYECPECGESFVERFLEEWIACPECGTELRVQEEEDL